MKKIMWIVAMLPVIVTSLVFQFIPDTIPMHHDLAGNTDRWGNKAESFIFPAVILVITLFWNLMINAYEKKAAKAGNDKERVEATQSAKLLGIVGVCQAVMFSVMDFFILYSSVLQANEGGDMATVDIAKISCILCGIMFMVLGNYMTKAKRNATIGVRTVWSMHNDNTWRRSNRMGAYAIITAGLLTVITAAFTGGMICTVMMLVYLIVAAVFAVVYSKIVYDDERKKEL